MLTQSSFSPEEWLTVRRAPHLVALAVMTAGNSGITGSIGEAFTTARIFIEAGQGNNELFKTISSQEAMKSFRDEVTEKAKTTGGDVKGWLRTDSLSAATQALEIISRHGTAQEAAEYKTWLLSIADRVANASKEGSFLGFGGERVSEEETRMIGELQTALGGGAAQATVA